MKISIENKYELGQRFYALQFQNKNVYRPCRLCGNTRKVSIPFEGTQYTVECPRCAKKHIKGEEDSFLTVRTAKVEEYTLTVVHVDQYLTVTVDLTSPASLWSSTFKGISFRKLSDLLQSGELYLSREEAKKAAMAHNRKEKSKERKFLSEEENSGT